VSGVFLSPLYPTTSLMLAVAFLAIATVTVERRRADTAILAVKRAVRSAEAASRQTSNAQRLMIETLLSLTQTRDAETGEHCRRTSQYARLLADGLAKHAVFQEYLTPERIDLLSRLAPLHDIGKVGVPDAILNKPGPLTSVERAEMQRHPSYGRDVICRAEHEAGITDDVILSMAKQIVYTHHEKWDGSGYPEGLKGPNIPIPGRIVALVDAYDACTSARIYREPMPHERAVQCIVDGKGSHFDPDIVDTFLTIAHEMSLVRVE
jgi:response regulator RpfG family c-di-GMP phosphodiesterase